MQESLAVRRCGEEVLLMGIGKWHRSAIIVRGREAMFLPGRWERRLLIIVLHLIWWVWKRWRR